MPRNDGIDRTLARNRDLSASEVGRAQAHNEREKETYSNPDIVPEQTFRNVHFKQPTSSYTEMFGQLKKDGVISTRGLKEDAVTYCELLFDVNSAYFYNHGGYEFAKQFYADAYRAAVQIVGGEQYILSATMHADERNRAMSEALGEDVYHYHLHVVYIPVVEKQILWSKRCKDKSLIGTVKETIMQVSRSKKWESRPALDENGNQLLTKNGKKVLTPSYSILQDDFYNAMIAAGYTDVERGQRGSTEEHLTVTQFKVAREQERLAELTQQTQQQEQQAEKLEKKIEKIQQKQVDIDSIDKIQAKPLKLSPSKVSLEKSEYDTLSIAAKKYYAQEKKTGKLQKALDAAKQMIQDLKKQIAVLTAELKELRSTRGTLKINSLETENRDLRGKIQRYETIIDRQNLWHLFGRGRSKSHAREDAR